MSHKIDYLTATNTDEAKPVGTLRAIPTRLSAKAVTDVLQGLGFNIPSLAAAADKNPDISPTVRFGFQREPSMYAIELRRIDAALSKTALPFSERLRFKYACDRLGLLK